MIDSLVLPLLALVIVGFLAFIWIAWLSRADGRALQIVDKDEGR